MALSTTAAAAAAAAPLPAQKFTVRSGKVGIRTYLGPTKLGAVDEALTSPEGRLFEYSRDGNLLAIGTATEIIIQRVTTGEVQARISRRGVEHISFSPQGNYLLTWEHMPKDLPEDEKKVYGNLNVWSTKTGEHIHRFIQKAFLRENWPSLRWSDDELICGRMVSNEIQFYAGKIGQVARIVKLPNVSAFSISPGGAPYKIAAFAGESKGMPGMVRIYKYPEVAQHVAHKSFFKAQNVDLMWNAQGTALLIGAHTDVDRSGKSYYGEDSLYYMTTEGKVENVSLPKEGPIHSTSWSPTGKEFLVIYGFMPAQATLFGVDCKPKCDFGAAPRNTINWDPFGRIVCISGFGNLQGDMDFWDVRKLKKVGTATAHCSAHFEWAPDGIHVITAVLSPRIRVDNGYKIWRCDGTLLHHEAVDELLKVAWRPSLTGIFPEPRPPPPLGASTKGQPSSPSSTTAPTAAAAPAPAPAAPAKYRHPNFTGADVKVREQSTGPVKYSAKAVPKKDLPAGAVFVSKTTNKNKKKRQNKKKTETGGEPAPESSEAEATEAAETESTGGADVEKRIKALTKKLRQIAQLKEQAAAGKVLDAAQKEKLQSESQLAEQLKQLQAKQ